MSNKVLLMILDGFCSVRQSDGKCRSHTRIRPNLDLIFAKYPTVKIAASGLDVGLPKGQMGNSEVGHLIMGSRTDSISGSNSYHTKSICDVSFLKTKNFLRLLIM
jgi:2,3-bisphosphoglycerate-independent phosphoglycerate mutase